MKHTFTLAILHVIGYVSGSEFTPELQLVNEGDLKLTIHHDPVNNRTSLDIVNKLVNISDSGFQAINPNLTVRSQSFCTIV